MPDPTSGKVGVDFERAGQLGRQLQTVNETTLEGTLPKLQNADATLKDAADKIKITGDTTYQDAYQGLQKVEGELGDSATTLASLMPQLIDAVQGDIAPNMQETVEKWKQDFSNFATEIGKLNQAARMIHQNLIDLTQNIGKLNQAAGDLQPLISAVQQDLGDVKLPHFIQWCAQMHAGMVQGVSMWRG